MNALLSRIQEIALTSRYRRFGYLIVLSIIAWFDYFTFGVSRYSFEFFSVQSKGTIVESRMLPRSGSQEERVQRYVGEYLLGPSSVVYGRLFPKETRLDTLMIRGDTVYLDLTEAAAIPVETEVDARRSLSLLTEGIRRNFPSVKEVSEFIAGHELSFIGDDILPDRGEPKKAKSVDK